jgi:hypothetical protein
MVVALPFIGIDPGTPSGESVNVFSQGLLVGMPHQPQPNLATLAADGADNGWTIIIINAVTVLWLMSNSRTAAVWAASLSG